MKTQEILAIAETRSQHVTLDREVDPKEKLVYLATENLLQAIQVSGLKFYGYAQTQALRDNLKLLKRQFERNQE